MKQAGLSVYEFHRRDVFSKFNTHSFSHNVKPALRETYLDRCNIENCCVCVHTIGHSLILPLHTYFSPGYRTNAPGLLHPDKYPWTINPDNYPRTITPMENTPAGNYPQTNPPMPDCRQSVGGLAQRCTAQH